MRKFYRAYEKMEEMSEGVWRELQETVFDRFVCKEENRIELQCIFSLIINYSWSYVIESRNV